MPLLTAAEVKNAGPGKHQDGQGLFLRVYESGAKCWVLRLTVDRRRREIGLGGWPEVSLADARRKTLEHRAAVAGGRDILAEKRRARVPTFREAAKSVHEAHRPRWRSDRHAANWWASLEKHAFPEIGDMRVDRINQSDVLRVLTPIWTTRPEVARKTRQRIRTILRWAMAHGYVQFNMAGEVIEGALPPMPRVKSHFRSLPYSKVAEALAVVEESGASPSAKLCLRFVVLTAARSGEARNATWDEIDFETCEWKIPAERMKAASEHRVPLSEAAMDVLGRAKACHDGSDLVFPSPLKPGRPLSDMTLTKILRDVGLSDRATVHGFRASFRTWALEETDAPWAVAEAALAHSLGDSVQQAYIRGDAYDKRRKLMDQWADYLDRL
ncbi:MAG: tyrosine-type recombinase/integrase [Acidimicrobiia bacterium]|nr:tyrosine-type recombinase/integrase [Acidimicrobiia bacterium]MYG59944.1 tyrosine-type recombinase/integrase [Acidimicrobiia bacterium]MYJ31120.1 tyrosine-type recombinase/integrase [Acidimicrobiia bacterium]